MKRSYLSACVGCLMAMVPFAQADAQTTPTTSTASLFLNGADFSLQLLSGNGTLNSGPLGGSVADASYNGISKTVYDPSNNDPASSSNASVNFSFGSATGSTQGYTALATSAASKGLTAADASYTITYTAGAGALFEVSVPYTMSLAGYALGQADIQTTVFNANGVRQVLSDQESAQTLGQTLNDSGYLDLVIRNNSNAPQQYQVIFDDQVQSNPPISPIPEPASFQLLLSGLAIMGVVAYRRRDSRRKDVLRDDVSSCLAS